MIESGGTLIATLEARNACKDEPDMIERIKKAMRACHDHWMETVETNQFRAAIAGALLESDGLERDRIEQSMKSFVQFSNALAAAATGVPIKWESIEPPPDNVLPLRDLWEQTKPGARS